MFWASTAVPTWRSTTSALEFAPASTTTCWAAGSSDSPVSVTITGSATWASRGTEITVASRNEDHAFAETRSSGMPADPTRESSRPTEVICTASSPETDTLGAGPCSAASSRPRRRLMGVKRQSSSLLLSGGKSATS